MLRYGLVVRRRVWLVLGLVALGGVMPARCALGKVITWVGTDSANSGWNVTTNWLGGVTFANNDDVVFYDASIAPTTITATLAANRTVKSLTFNSNAAASIAISGNTLTVGTGGITTDGGATGSYSISSTIALNAAQTWNIGGAGPLTVGAVNTSGTGDRTLTKTGAGTLVLAGALAPSSLAINQGTVQLSAGNLLGDALVVTVNAGGTLDLNGKDDVWGGLSGTGAVSNAAAVGLRVADGAEVIFGGTLTEGATASSLSRQTITGAGTGIQTFTAALGHTSFTAALGGVLKLADTGGSALATSEYRIGQTASTNTRAGWLVLDNSLVNNDNRLRDDTATINFRLNSYLKLIGNDSVATAESTHDLYLRGGQAVIALDARNGGDVLLWANSLLRDAGTTALVRGDRLGGAAGAGNATYLAFGGTAPVNSHATSGTQTGVVPYLLGDHDPDNGVGSGLVTYDAGVGLRLLTDAEYATTLSGHADENVRLTASQSLATSTTIRALSIDGAASQTVLSLANNSRLTVESATILATGAVGARIEGGQLTFGNNAATSNEGYFHVAGYLDVASTIADNGAALSIIKDGPGTLTLLATAGYTGSTYIQNGTVAVGVSHALGDGSLTLEGTLRLNAGLVDTVGGISSNGAGSIELNSGSSLAVNATANATYWGLVSGPADATLTKTGAATWNLKNNSSGFVGTLVVDGGTLALSETTGRLINLSEIVLSSGILKLDNASNPTSQSDRINSPVTLRGGELLIVAPNANVSESITGNLTLARGTSTVTLNPGGTGDVVFTAPSLVRNGRATGLVRGDNLGQTTAGADGRLLLTTGPTLTHSGGSSATQDEGIVPYLFGDTSAAGLGSDLVTYNGTGLALVSGYATSIATGANKNVKLAASDATSGSAVIRGLVLNNTGTTISVNVGVGNTLTVESGAIISTSTTGNLENAIGAAATSFLTFGNPTTGYEGVINTIRNLRIYSTITDNAGNQVSLTKTGTGTIVLHAPSSYTGPTTINQGVLQLPAAANNDNRLPTSTVLDIAAAGTFRLQGRKQQVGGLTGEGVVENVSAASAGTFTINSAAGSYFFAGVLRSSTAAGSPSALHVVKTGAGSQTFSGNNSYTGTTTISGGTLVAGHDSALGFGGLQTAGAVVGNTVVAGGATLDLNGRTINEPISLNGGSLTNSSFTAAVVGGGLAGATFTNATNGLLANAVFTVDGGGGSGATLNRPWLSLTSASVASISGGTLYQVNDVVNLTGATTLSGATLGQIKVTAVDANGAITGYQFQSGGFGYTSLPTTVQVAHSGTAATVSAVDGTLQLYALQIATAGSGYTGTPTLTASGWSGTAPTAVLSSLSVDAPSSIGGTGDIVLAGPLQGSGKLTKVGPGRLTLGNTSAYTGAISVADGTLQFDAPAAGGSATVQVQPGGTLQGHGTVPGLVEVYGGSLQPGGSIGSIQLAGGLTALGPAGSKLVIEAASLTSYDQVVVTSGNVDLGNELIALQLGDGLGGGFQFTPSGADDYLWIIDNQGSGSLSGQFAGLSNGAAVTNVGGTPYYIYYGADAGGANALAGGNDVVITNVPEPSTWAMLFGVFAVASVYAWRQHQFRRNEQARRNAYHQYLRSDA